MKKKKFVQMAKIFVVSVLFVMIYVLFNSTVFDPPKVFGAAGGDDWGDSFKNDKGKTICICDESEADCKPCVTIKIPEQ